MWTANRTRIDHIGQVSPTMGNTVQINNAEGKQFLNEWTPW